MPRIRIDHIRGAGHHEVTKSSKATKKTLYKFFVFVYFVPSWSFVAT